MTQMSGWLGVGIVAAGVSAALIAGADPASADTSADSAGPGVSAGPSRTDHRSATPSSAQGGAGATAADSAGDSDSRTTSGRQARSAADTADRGARGASRTSARATEDDEPAFPAVAQRAPQRFESKQSSTRTASVSPDVATSGEQPLRTRVLSDPVAAQPLRATGAEAEPTAAARRPSLPEAVQSLVFDVIGVAVTAIAGPPVAAPGTNVTVRSSTLEIAPGRAIPADWYYPAAGVAPPQRLIYLQHGFLGVGAMYSYTASYLADRTDSIVVVPTLSSNRFVRDGFWLGDDQVYRATADLLLGDREALTASAVAAGFAERYGAAAALPEEFMIFGHSLGAGVAAGAAGYYAQAVSAGGAPNRLAGLVLLDGAPPANVLPDGLDALELLDGYIPVFELGAPKPSRRVDTALIEQRPGRYNGIVLDEGKHLDAMQGGTPAIQFISYLYQGFPTEKNKWAAQTIIAGWANDVFAGRIDPSTGRCDGAVCAGIYAAPGDPVEIPTPLGAATGVVIGKPTLPAMAQFAPASAGALSGGGVFIPV